MAFPSASEVPTTSPSHGSTSGGHMESYGAYRRKRYVLSHPRLHHPRRPSGATAHGLEGKVVTTGKSAFSGRPLPWYGKISFNIVDSGARYKVYEPRKIPRNLHTRPCGRLTAQN